jgi:hypothetical protein
VVERYRLLDYEAAKTIEEHNEEDNAAVAMVDNGVARDPDYKGKGLQLELSVEDEGVFTMPWSASMIYWPPLVPMGRGQKSPVLRTPTAMTGAISPRKRRCR